MVSGYQWQLSGPTGTSELAGVAEQIVQLDLPGKYTIILTVTEFALQGSTTVTNTGTATKTVIVSFPDEAVFSGNKEGGEFKGGIFIQNELLPNNSTVNQDTVVDVIAEIIAVPDFLTTGQPLGTVDMYIVATYQPLDSEIPLWFMKDEDINNFKLWDLDFNHLLPANKTVTFDENKKTYVSIFSGPLISPGEYNIYIGYDSNDQDLDMERAIYTIELISFTVVPDE